MTGQITPAVTYSLQQAKQDASALLLKPNRNIVGVGIGKKITGGKQTTEDCVRIYVVSKIGMSDLSPSSLVPPDFHGVPTDVIECGCFGWKGKGVQPRVDPTAQLGSPIRVRTSAPNVNQGHRGTLGALVTDGTNRYILSCNHILAVNGRVPKDAAVVSAEFVGTEETLAKPAHFVELVRGGANSVDCALAQMYPATKVQAVFPDGTALTAEGPGEASLDRKVTKFGAVTGRTYGTVVDIDADLYIDYSFGTFRFEHQMMIDGGGYDAYIAAAGDSGSLVVDTDTRQATAMIFAASGRFAVACRLTDVFQALGKSAGNLSLVVK